MKDLTPAGLTPRPDLRPASRAGAGLGRRLKALVLSDYFVLYLSLAYFARPRPVPADALDARRT